MDHQYNGCVRHSVNWLVVEHGYECPLCVQPKISPEFVKELEGKYKNLNKMIDKIYEEASNFILEDGNGSDEPSLFFELIQALKESKGV